MKHKFIRKNITLLLVLALLSAMPAAVCADASHTAAASLPETLSKCSLVCIHGEYYGGYCIEDEKSLLPSWVPMEQDEIYQMVNSAPVALFSEGEQFSAENYSTFRECFSAMVANEVTESVDISKYNLTVSDVVTIMMFSCDSQWVDSFSYKSPAGNDMKVVALRLMYKPVFKTEHATYEAKIREIIRSAEQYESEIEQLLFLHDYITDNTNYDYTYTNYMGYELLRDGVGVCNAQTLLYSDLLNRLGIENKFVESSQGTHIWNALVLNGNWYMADVTWDNTEDGTHLYENFLVSEQTMRYECQHLWNDYGKNVLNPLFTVICEDESLENMFWRIDPSFVLEYRDGNPYVLYGEHSYRFDPDGLCLRMDEEDESLCSSGYCGNDKGAGFDDISGAYKNLSWTLEEDGTLQISGFGTMKNYAAAEDTPWYRLRWAITRVVLSDGVTGIGEKAFQNCELIKEITLPSDLEFISSGVFTNCCSLLEITIPDGVSMTVGLNEFSDCKRLRKLYLGDCVTFGSMAYYICNSCVRLTDVHLPDGITKINHGFFLGCKNLCQIKIPSGVTEIQTTAFSYCDNLRYISFPKTINKISQSAFLKSDQVSSVCFAGTQTEWNAILIEDGNESLLAADICYETASFPALDVIRNGHICSVFPLCGQNGDSIVCAQYVNNQMLKLDICCYEGTRVDFAIDTIADDVQIFVLDDEWVPRFGSWCGDLT